MSDLTKNLSRIEFKCPCGCGFDTVDFDLPYLIQGIVDHFQRRNQEMDIRVRINSGARCVEHNKAVGGGDKSQHLYGKAADMVIYDKLSGKDIHADDVADYLEEKYNTSKGIGRYNGRTHIDCRPNKARWDVR